MKRAIIIILGCAVCIASVTMSTALERKAVVNGSRVQMHESANGDSTMTGLLSDEAVVDILGREAKPAVVGTFTDYWYLVSFRGKTGWVYGQFLLPSSGGRGLARIYTKQEMIDYCDRAVANIAAVAHEGYFIALVDSSNVLIADIDAMTVDTILSAHARSLEPYRVFAVWSLALGYAGTNETKKAEEIRDRLQASDPGMKLPDGSTLGIKLPELDKMIRDKTQQ